MKLHHIKCITGIILTAILLTGCVQETAGHSSEAQAEEIATYFKIDNSREYTATIPVSPNILCNYTSSYATIPYMEPVNSNVAVKLCIDCTDNVVLDAENPFERVYPASITKIMTALLVLENGNLNDSYTITEPIDLGDPMAVSLGLSVGDTFTVEELMYGMLLESANDYAIALGRYVSGSDDAFVKMMNDRAWQLGATHTHFMNSNGLHDDEHYSTGYDLYLIFNELIKHEEFREIAGQPSHVLKYTDADGNVIEKTIGTSNMFINGEQQEPEGIEVFCGKTGTTSEAGFCLIVAAKDNNKEYITLVCGASSRPNLYSIMTKELELINEE